MDWDDEYESEPTLMERIIMLAWLSIPYAVGILVMCVLVWIICTFAAGVENRGASDQWGRVIESARNTLENCRETEP